MPRGVDLNTQTAFARVPFPEHFGLCPTEFMELPDPEALSQVQPDKIREGLTRRAPNNSVYTGLRDHEAWLVLGAAEYTTLVRSPEHFSASAAARNQTQIRALMRGQDDRNATARRAGAHSLEAKIEKMEHMQDLYRSQITDLRALKERIKHPWFRRGFGNEEYPRAFTARQLFLDSLQTLADAREWTADDLHSARYAMDFSLLGGQRTRPEFQGKINYWGDMVKTIGNYTIEKGKLFKDRTERSKRIINQALESRQ